jgi:hypothetical protein
LPRPLSIIQAGRRQDAWVLRLHHTSHATGNSRYRKRSCRIGLGHRGTVVRGWEVRLWGGGRRVVGLRCQGSTRSLLPACASPFADDLCNNHCLCSLAPPRPSTLHRPLTHAHWLHACRNAFQKAPQAPLSPATGQCAMTCRRAGDSQHRYRHVHVRVLACCLLLAACCLLLTHTHAHSTAPEIAEPMSPASSLQPPACSLQPPPSLPPPPRPSPTDPPLLPLFVSPACLARLLPSAWEPCRHRAMYPLCVCRLPHPCCS